MRIFFATKLRQIVFSSAIFLTALAVAILLAWHHDTKTSAHSWNIEEIMLRLLIAPIILGAAAFKLSSTEIVSTATAAPPDLSILRSNIKAITFSAQIVGVQWMNPLVRRDYPTEWQLLWTLGLAKPNKNDDMVRTDPTSFSTVQPVAAIVWNMGNKVSFSSFFGGYVRRILVSV